jgi:hypothetical protein
MIAFEKNQVLGTYTLLKRTLHREGEGGYEIWRFEIDDKKFIFYSDIRYLKEIDERVIVVDFFAEEALELLQVDPYTLTNNSNYSASKVLGCLHELICRILPPLRKYRYVAFPGGPTWSSLHKRVVNKYSTFVTDEKVLEAVKMRLNYKLIVEIDSGYSHCDVGDLISNLDFIDAGLNIKENRQKVNLEPVSLIN